MRRRRQRRCLRPPKLGRDLGLVPVVDAGPEPSHVSVEAHRPRVHDRDGDPADVPQLERQLAFASGDVQDALARGQGVEPEGIHEPSAEVARLVPVPRVVPAAEPRGALALVLRLLRAVSCSVVGGGVALFDSAARRWGVVGWYALVPEPAPIAVVAPALPRPVAAERGHRRGRPRRIRRPTLALHGSGGHVQLREILTSD